MNETIEAPATRKRPPGLENLIGAELARLAANPKLREVVRAEFARRPELLEVACRGRCGKRLRLSASEPPRPNCRYTCKECCRDRSILDTPCAIEKSLEGKLPGQKRRIYETLASTRASRGPYIVDYPNGHFGYSEGGYKPYRRNKVKKTSRDWRKNNPEWTAEYKRLYRLGYRSRARRGQRSRDNRNRRATGSNAAWYAKLEQFGFACSSCGGTLTIKTAIRWREGATSVPVCAACRGRKAAKARWKKEKRLKKAS
jgi:hypothetical protein